MDDKVMGRYGHLNAIQYRGDAELMAEITARTDMPTEAPESKGWENQARNRLSLRARSDLQYYYEALRRELAAIHLEEAEALLLVDALNGVIHEPHTVPEMADGVADAIRLDGLGSKWGVKDDTLLDKLNALTYTQLLALIDAAQRWWLLQDGNGNRTEALRAVGLLRRPVGSLEP